MKITKKQLRRLIEASIIKRGDDYVAPIEAPLEDPRKFDFDMSDENKDKLLGLAGSDPESGNPAMADSLADTLGFPSSGRFGADTLSKQMTMYDAGLDLLNDPEIDQVVNVGVDRYFNERRRDSFSIDLDDILKTGYKYPEGPGGFQLYLEGDPNWYEKMPAGFDLNDADFMTVDEPHLHIDIVNGIMDEIRFLLKIKFKNVQSITNNIELTRAFLDHETEEALSPKAGSKEQHAAKLQKAYHLFKRRTYEDRIHFGPAVVQHIYDKAMQPMYEIFTETIYKHNPDQDMSQIKESKIKITRKQLRRLIAEAFKQKVPLFDPVTQGEIDALRQKGRQDADLSGLSPSNIPKLKALDQSGVPASVNQARQLYSALGSTEPVMSVEQEEDFLLGQDDYLVDLQDYNIEQALEDVFINDNRDPKLLKQLGFTRFGDLDPNYKRSMMKSNSWYYGHVEAILNKPIDDLMYVESVSFNSSRLFYSIKNFLDNHEQFRKSYAGNELLKVYSKKAKITDVVADQSFAVGFMFGGNDSIFII